MSKLLSPAQLPDETGCIQHITPAKANWDYVGFESYQLVPGQVLEQNSNQQEVCIVIVGGKATVSNDNNTWENLGSRVGPFDRIPPDAIYIAPGERFKITATSDLEVALAKAPSTGKHPSRLIPASSLAYVSRGHGTNERWVCNILFGDNDADSLLVVEVITPDGHWSSYPPHKHDSDDGDLESQLEETYYHRINPSQGFAFQRVYTDDKSLDETMSVEDKGVVMVPEGYHPVGAPHGYELYYLNVMAGSERRWVFKNDPQHEWIMNK